METEAKQDEADKKDDVTKHKMTFALWTYIKRIGRRGYLHLLRVVIEEEESFKDVILREIWPFLVMNRHSSHPPSTVQKQDEETENERDKLFKFITESCKFRIMKSGSGGQGGLLLSEEVLIKPDIVSSLNADMTLIMYLPKLKTDSRNTYHD